jgi:SNF family Na+-dependent transporter
MGRSEIYLIFILIVLFAGFSSYHYIFSIYEVTYKVTPDKLYADNNSTLIIEAVPINSFGWKAPFRKTFSEFTFNEGKELVEIIFKDNSNGILKLRAKEKSGKVSITINQIFTASIYNRNYYRT